MIDWHSIIWDLLADGLTVDEIKDGISTFNDSEVDEVKKDYDEMEME